MSETFFIKQTLFDDFSNDITLRESTSFIIGPGELDGPNGRTRNSDLELYGFGSLKWGEGVNQNLFRMLENNACPEKTAGSPPVSIIPPTPVDEIDLGLGNGITTPIIGQTWFNTTDEELYMYGTAGWTLVTATATFDLTTLLNDHIADDTLHLTTEQNTFLDGLLLTGSPLLTSLNVNQLIGFDESFGTVQQQLDLMVEKAGDTMTGNLVMISSDSITGQVWFEGGDHRITTNDGGGDFNIRIGHVFSSIAVDNVYSDTGSGAVLLTASHEGSPPTAPTFQIKVGEDSSLAVAGLPVGFTGTTTFKSDGNVQVSAVSPNDDADLVRKDYVDINVLPATVPIGGIIMYNGLFSAIPGNWQLCDGTNGTPNMTNRFAYGTNTEGNLNNTGGSADAVVVSHNHTRGSMNIKGSLSNIVKTQRGSSISTGAISHQGQTIDSDGGERRSGMKLNFNAANGWTGSTSTAGSSGVGKNIPPYIELAYIRRMS